MFWENLLNTMENDKTHITGKRGDLRLALAKNDGNGEGNGEIDENAGNRGGNVMNIVETAGKHGEMRRKSTKMRG